jgi:tRNA(Arg) A34 adenosine deaminase TadA
MCLGAIYWARPKVVYYANNRQDAASIDFDDSMIYEELGLDIEKRRIPMVALGREEALKVFMEWQSKSDRVEY